MAAKNLAPGAISVDAKAPCTQFLFISGCSGDQILEWDGSSLKDATFEEAEQLLTKSGDTVQLVVVRTR